MFKIEIYRPTDDGAFTRSWFDELESRREKIAGFLTEKLSGAASGTFALVIIISDDAGTRKECLVERWRVDATGRILRSQCASSPEVARTVLRTSRVE